MPAFNLTMEYCCDKISDKSIVTEEMIMLRISNIKLSLDEDENDLKQKVRKILSGEWKTFRIAKKSIDARRKNDVHMVYSVDVEVSNEAKLCKKIKNAQLITNTVYKFPNGRKFDAPIVIVGTGPAGMMCGLVLAQNGYNVILLERGKCVKERKADVERFWKSGELNSESNVQFGEGGAGTFSDGKLTTGVNDFRIRKVLEEFYAHGAPEEILYTAKPHIGTDNLYHMAENIREDIIRMGGKVCFSHKMTEIVICDGQVRGVKVQSPDGEYEIKSNHVVLAIGHSARDTFEMLRDSGLDMEQKNFSIGVRIEHLQKMINVSQYGEAHEKLGAADYKLSLHLENGRSAYTFCMCPGGQVVASASEEGGVVTNGMSNFARDGKNANSALLVNVTPDDFGSDDVLAGMYMQRDIERKAYKIGGGSYKAPAQRVGDFLGTECEETEVEPTYKPGVKWSDITEVLPAFVTDTIREALPILDRRLHGFASPDAVMTAPETRSSSPVRIIRGNENFQSNIKGVYPCGEGAGYAGGITTAAVDGIKVAEAIAGLY